VRCFWRALAAPPARIARADADAGGSCAPAAALTALKKKKMYETQLEQVENNILRVNEQQMMLENQRTTVETVSALRNAAHASKATMSEMKINDVDQVRGRREACGLTGSESLPLPSSSGSASAVLRGTSTLCVRVLLRACRRH